MKTNTSATRPSKHQLASWTIRVEEFFIFLFPSIMALCVLCFSDACSNLDKSSKIPLIVIVVLLFFIGVIVMHRRSFPVDKDYDYHRDLYEQDDTSSILSGLPKATVGISVSREYRYNRILEYYMLHGQDKPILDFIPRIGGKRPELKGIRKTHYDRISKCFADSLTEPSVTKGDRFVAIYDADSDASKEEIRRRLGEINDARKESRQTLYIITNGDELDLVPTSWKAGPRCDAGIRPMGFTVARDVSTLGIPSRREEGETALFFTGKVHDRYFKSRFEKIFSHLRARAIPVLSHGEIDGAKTKKLGVDPYGNKACEKPNENKVPRDRETVDTKALVLLIILIALTPVIESILAERNIVPSGFIPVIVAAFLTLLGLITQGMRRRLYLGDRSLSFAMQNDTEEVAGVVFEGSGYLHSVKMLNPQERNSDKFLVRGEVRTSFNMTCCMLSAEIGPIPEVGWEALHHEAIVQTLPKLSAYKHLYSIYDQGGLNEGLLGLVTSLKNWLGMLKDVAGNNVDFKKLLIHVNWRAIRFSWAFPNMFIVQPPGETRSMLLSFTEDGSTLDTSVFLDGTTSEAIIESWSEYFDEVWNDAIPIVTRGKLADDDINHLIKISGVSDKARLGREFSDVRSILQGGS